MQQLGMAGGRFEVALVGQESPQSFGLESAEFLVAGHAGSTPRPLGKVASGGELSRIALAIAVTTSTLSNGETAAGTLIFDEVDAGVGGAVAETVGRLMKQLGRERQVLAVTHLPQVAACADHHFVVSKLTIAGVTRSAVDAVTGEARVAEVARMLGGERLSGTSLAHAQEMIAVGSAAPSTPSTPSAAQRPATPPARRR
jgi:DNA repair protein RecN (Recombination protein N)